MIVAYFLGHPVHPRKRH